MASESIALASIIDAGNADLPVNCGRMLQYAPDSFSDPAYGQIAVKVRNMRAAGEAVTPVTVGSRCMEICGQLATLMNDALPLAAAEAEAEKCWQAYQVRQARKIGAELVQELKDSPQLAASIISAARAGLDEIASQTKTGLPELIDAAEFIARPIAPPVELVEGILHKGSKLVFGGGTKSFKTWCLLDLCISVAAGFPWMGRHTAPGRVLFVNFEIQSHAWQRRISAVAEAKGAKIAIGQTTLWNLRGHAADFRQLIPRIIERARREGFALIILDPIYKLYGNTDENSAGNVALLLNALESLATETGAAIAFGAHFAKGNAAGKEAIDRISGSGVFARDPDSLLMFTKHETDDAFTVEPILRNFAPVAPFAVRWVFPLMCPAHDLDPAKLKQAGGRPAKHRPDDLLALLPPGGLTNKDWLAAAGQKGISARTFYRLREDLKKAGKVFNSVSAGKWMPIQPK